MVPAHRAETPAFGAMICKVGTGFRDRSCSNKKQPDRLARQEGQASLCPACRSRSGPGCPCTWRGAGCATSPGGCNAHPLLRWRFTAAVKTDRLLIAPQDLRTADPTRASEIYAGRFAFAGKIVICDGRSPFEMTPPSEEWADTLLGFGWLRHLRAAESGITPRQCARAGRRMDRAAGFLATRPPGSPTWWRGASCRG